MNSAGHRAKIRRASYGVPHITATSSHLLSKNPLKALRQVERAISEKIPEFVRAPDFVGQLRVEVRQPDLPRLPCERVFVAIGAIEQDALFVLADQT